MNSPQLNPKNLSIIKIRNFLQKTHQRETKRGRKAEKGWQDPLQGEKNLLIYMHYV